MGHYETKLETVFYIIHHHHFYSQQFQTRKEFFMQHQGGPTNMNHTKILL